MNPWVKIIDGRGKAYMVRVSALTLVPLSPEKGDGGGLYMGKPIKETWYAQIECTGFDFTLEWNTKEEAVAALKAMEAKLEHL